MFRISIIIFAFSSFFFACKSNKEEKKNQPSTNAAPPTGAEGYVIIPQTISNDIEVPGSLVPYEETAIHPEVSGKVTGIFFKEGSVISKGATLIKLYDGDLQAQLQKLAIQLKIARKTEERQSELLKISGISQQDYDLSLLQLNNIEADMNIIRTSIAKTNIKAPYSGRLGLRNISMGAYVTTQTIITTLRQLNELKLVFTVPEKYGPLMQPGQTVHFMIEGHPDQFPARVIATENNIAEETRSLMVKAVVDKHDDRLVAGSFAKVKLTLGKDAMALMAPTQAIIPQARNKKIIVYRNGSAVFETVTTGIRDSSRVEITSGLKAGDTIITTGLLSIKPGSKVKLSKVNN
jgi:membrane fusion protein, multidrug efflux system